MRLHELNRTAKYYRDNPDKVLPQQLGKWRPDKDEYRSPEVIYKNVKKYNQAIQKFEDKWKRIAGDVNLIVRTGYPKLDLPIWKLFKPISAMSPYGMSDDHYLVDWSLKRYLKSKEDMANHFIKWNDDITQEEKDSMQQFIDNHYDAWSRDAQNIGKIFSHVFPNHPKLLSKKATQKGVEFDDYQIAIAELKRYTSMSGKRIDKKFWPILQKMTVTPGELPEYVYRGLFYDGAKIKDLAKWQSKWYEGGKPNMKFTKATSWSTSPTVAVAFMQPQDKIKDKENGFHVLLRYEIKDPSLVIADLRSLPDLRFWNQQEILLSPEARDYEVVDVFVHQEDWGEGKTEKWKEIEDRYKNSGFLSGSHGYSMMEFIKFVFFNVRETDVTSDLKEEIKSLSDSTVREFEDHFSIALMSYDGADNERFADPNDIRDIKMSLMLMSRGNSLPGIVPSIGGAVIKIYSPTKVRTMTNSFHYGEAQTEIEFDLEVLRSAPNSFVFNVDNVELIHEGKKGMKLLTDDIDEIHTKSKNIKINIS